jgi:hypothetical protein
MAMKICEDSFTDLSPTLSLKERELGPYYNKHYSSIKQTLIPSLLGKGEGLGLFYCHYLFNYPYQEGYLYNIKAKMDISLF